MLASSEFVRVHRQTHGASGLTPLHTRCDKNLVQTFGLGLLLDLSGTRHHQRPLDSGGDFLAFDHCGGGVKWNTVHTGYELTFANAKYWTHSEHWHTATFPNAREKATFFKENILPIQEAGQLYFSDKVENPFGANVQPMYADGHTEKMTMFKIEYKGQTVVFMADTIPSHAHIPVPYVMGYDVRPLETMKEKETLLKEALENNYLLFFDHDPSVDCCTVEMTEKGIRVKDKGLLGDFVK